MIHNDYPPHASSSSAVLQLEPFAVLALENDPCEALLLEQAFYAAGLRVPLQFVADQQELISYLKGEEPFSNRGAHPEPAVLLLQADLPRLNPISVLEWLRTHPRREQMLVAVLGTREEYAGQAHALGADFFFLRPSDPGDLVEVAESLRRAWQER